MTGNVPIDQPRTRTGTGERRQPESNRWRVPDDWAWLEALIVHLRPGDALGVTVHENSTVAIDLACPLDDGYDA